MKNQNYMNLSLTFSLFIILFVAQVNAQSLNYRGEIVDYQKKYKQEFLEDESSPLNKNDTSYIQFYQPNKSFKVIAHFSKINDTIGFIMKTHTQREKKYYVYGVVSFVLKNKLHKLYLYQRKNSENVPDEDLFLPFTDNTNYKETYGGGRYLDIQECQIQNSSLVIDFNKSYNPYCAYKEGYSCPIPPKENNLKIAIQAGEKLYRKNID